MAKLKYLFIAILALWMALYFQPLGRATDQPAQLTEAGHQLLERGQPAAAFHTWDKALKLYEQDRNSEGILGTKINQGLALSAMGQSPRVCSLLVEALSLDEWVCDLESPYTSTTEQRLTALLQNISSQPISALGLQSLGDTIQTFGKNEEAILILKAAVQRAADPNPIRLSLANAYASLYRQKLNQYELTEAYKAQFDPDRAFLESSQAALTLYEGLANSSVPALTLKAQLNRLELALALDPDAPQLKELYQQQQPLIPPLIGWITQADFNALSPVESVYGRLKFSDCLLKENPKQDKQLQTLETHLRAALLTAQDLDNKRAIADSTYHLGKLYQYQGQIKPAKKSFKEAGSLATAIQAWDLAYLSHAELAKLLQKAGDLAQSGRAYQAAIADLEYVRSSLLTVDHPFSYREEIDPVHRSYMQLLLSSPQPDLKAVIRTNEQLQIAQVENYLRCGRLDLVSLEQLRGQTQTPTVIHILQLGDQVEILVSTDKGIYRHSTPAAPVIKHLEFLSVNIDAGLDRTGIVLLDYASALYNALIAPIKPYLPESGTLIFVLDGDFQAIPMAMLWDGEQFLVENYSITNALGSKVAQPQALSPDQLKVLFAGLSEISPSQRVLNRSTPPLPFVEEEVNKVEGYSASIDKLLNSAFTAQRFQEELISTNIPILHISSHGQFSSDIDQTLIWAWDKPLNLRELKSLLHRKKDRQPLDLLVLSACQTAMGDRRATLGMAGVAAQVGARSTLASLWLVDDASTAKLMASFYENLQGGKTKAEALQAAQISLITSEENRHPFFWASFLLIGSWA